MSDSDSSELALPACSFSDSEDEVCRKPAADAPPVYVGLEGEELRSYFTASLRELNGVPRHNHRDRHLAGLPPEALGPAPELLASGGPLPYVDVSAMSAEAFTRDFVVPRRPAMLLNATDGWRAAERWSTRERMLEHYGDVQFKVSEIYSAFHTGGKPLKVELPLRLYVEVVEATGADFPFYIFERDLEGPRAPLLEDYAPPPYFRDDLYDTTEYTRAFFPLYRYMVIGVERTGSNIHVDPSCTSAWNTLLCGLKRWCLFPPGNSLEYQQRIGAAGASMGSSGAAPANWWLDVLPGLRAEGADGELGMVECVQRPGETIYVPHGWWHCVLNIGFTVAITQNLLAPAELAHAWPELSKDWPDFTPKFARLLRDLRPDVELPPDAKIAAEAAERDEDVRSVDPLAGPSPLCIAPLSGAAY